MDAKLLGHELVDLPTDVAELEVAENLTDLAEKWKLEILVREATGNQTAVESCFSVD